LGYYKSEMEYYYVYILMPIKSLYYFMYYNIIIVTS